MKYEYKGKTYTISELAKLAKLNYDVMYQRIHDGWTVEEAVETRFNPITLYLYKGKEYTLKQLAELSGKSMYTLYNRIKREKWSVEDAVEKPSRRDRGKSK